MAKDQLSLRLDDASATALRGGRCKCSLVAEPAARRESAALRGAEDAIARARFARLAGLPDALDEEAKALHVCEAARYDPHRAADLLWGETCLDERALSADSIRTAGKRRQS